MFGCKRDFETNLTVENDQNLTQLKLNETYDWRDQNLRSLNKKWKNSG